MSPRRRCHFVVMFRRLSVVVVVIVVDVMMMYDARDKMSLRLTQ
jgi:hypothetical protein